MQALRSRTKPSDRPTEDALVAQLVEQWPCKLRVAGSIPAEGSMEKFAYPAMPCKHVEGHAWNDRGICNRCGLVSLQGREIINIDSHKPSIARRIKPQKKKQGLDTQPLTSSDTVRLNSKSQKVRVVKNLAWQWGHRCFYCNRPLNLDLVGTVSSQDEVLSQDYPTIDHYIPKAVGGKSEMSNLRLACPQCNHLKGSEKTFLNHTRKWEIGSPTRDCPNCLGTGFYAGEEHRGLCGWCDGRGEMTFELAMEKLAELLHGLRSTKRTLRRAQTVRDALREQLNDLTGNTDGAKTHAQLRESNERLRITIRQMAKELDSRPKS